MAKWDKRTHSTDVHSKDKSAAEIADIGCTLLCCFEFYLLKI